MSVARRGPACGAADTSPSRWAESLPSREEISSWHTFDT